MTIRIGTAGIPLTAKGSDTIAGLYRLNELGLDVMELAFVRQVYLRPGKALEAAEVARKLGISVTTHASYFINLASQKQDVQDASRKRIIDNLKIADIFGSPNITVHAGFYSGRSSEEAYSLVRSNLLKISEEYPSETMIGIETMGKQKSFGRIEEIIRLCKDCDNVCPVIDLGHIHCLGNGSLRTEDDFAAVFDRFEKELGLRKFHIHMSGMVYKDGNEKRHAPISTDEPDFRHLAKLLAERDYDCSVICESPLMEKDALMFKGWVENFS